MCVDTANLSRLFNQEIMDRLFPPQRTNQFFDALLGDPQEGAYDIRIAFRKVHDTQLIFDLELHQRPGKCLACNLTYGLPKVFKRHPIINIQGVVAKINSMVNGKARCTDWRLEATREISPQLHIVPLIIDFECTEAT